ncbi:NADH dehydrogenase (quinone) [Thermosipho africanus H17ap60334]|jgi:(2Fe-2S) ferredoxin|uniref:(2Fe-2S) ferredoxin domain-containing protein n=1 Tax=Thermosipho TaxID=2420 RepID=UPI00028D1134|nr:MULTISPECIES: (2Fe-2S) ferredoxin domain-containing protein [Thermosipho]HCF38940.1 (2Fe-2S) ferredoxin domain-containing protein [Thermosipho africanus]EKF49558.1 NADH dehydrogenase (quinone) [Thermosipho africanus H17ap60334]MBZ4650939.1 dehydrogenase (quinone) [Thermosipho sp. (in: thermotogales)]MDK2900007.1 NADH-quinone oxidoreductase subunit [Thermosipho sp. (in: thermotogales)]RDI91694.1 NADH dehydrogenase (quinone) [Thermosipho africanus Ob7]
MSQNKKILVCTDGCCSTNGKMIKKVLEEKIKQYNLQEKVTIEESGCMDACNFKPVISILPDKIIYKELTPEAVEKIVKEHLINGKIVEEYLLKR